MLAWIKREAVLLAAVLAAVISAFFVPPSMDYVGYLDLHVLALLFCLMLTVGGAKQAGVFEWVTGKLLGKAKNTRALALVLSAVCFVSSMLITNDVALITVVPLAIMTLSADAGVLISSVVMMTIAANLGSMFTPIGNPQNLYLYSAFELPLGEFFAVMLLPTLLSALLIVLFALTIRREPIQAQQETARLVWKSVLPWGVLFAVCVACVARVLDYRVMFVLVVLAVLILKPKLFRQVDYSLLLTFVAFFVFVGNMKCLPAVSELLAQTVIGHELAAGILVSQVISNVPAAVLLSGFCSNPAALLVGVNLGGLGTPIASMASLISYKLYAASAGARSGRYMVVFLVSNFAMLAVLWLTFAVVSV